jgi:tetratricopeptide (TPR) repeat protein
MNQDKMFNDLHRLLNSKSFENEEELQKFLDGVVGKEISSRPKEELTDEERAQDLVFEAQELPREQGKRKARQALELDSNCIEAYEYLGDTSRSIDKSIAYFKKGIEIGRERFGGAFLKENKGHFWGIFETRPFMRCLINYSDCLYAKEKVQESIAVLEELIELNPNDNQGVRDQLGLYYLQLDKLEEFRKLHNKFENDGGAFHDFNLALFIYKSEGRTKKANESLKYDMEKNEFVVPKLLQRKQQINKLPQLYGFGDENEATYYVFYAKDIWRQTFGALAWIREFGKKK